jgi:hypothetical protein
MDFHFESKDKARAALYDAALLILQADAALALPVTKTTIEELSKLCCIIENGYRISRSPLVDC